MAASQNVYKGSLTTLVLALLARHKKMYGYQITKEVQAQSAGTVALTEGALYPALHRLEAEGLLTVSIETVGNRQRKYYQLTETGKTEVVVKLAQFQTFVQQLSLLLHPPIAKSVK